MARKQGKIEKHARKHQGLIAIVGLALAAAVLAFPDETAGAAAQAASGGGDWFSQVLDFFGLGGGNESAHQRSWTATYRDGELEIGDEIRVDNNTWSDFTVKSTAPSGDDATFEVYCGETVCASETAPYEETTTVFVLSLPWTPEMTRLVITVGAEVEELEL